MLTTFERDGHPLPVTHFKYAQVTLARFQELLGLGLDLGPGMLSRGTMEREDEEPAKFRQTLAVRPEEEDEDNEAASEVAASEVMNESVVSSVVDK